MPDYRAQNERDARERQRYLQQVQQGRSVRRVDPLQPALSQPMDDVRQARGLGSLAYEEAKRRMVDLLVEQAHGR
jgi:predicted nucleic acid-binding Zn ribbon protein